MSMTGSRKRVWGGVLLTVAAAAIIPTRASAFIDAFFKEWNYQELDLSAAKEEFMARFGSVYGYDGKAEGVGLGRRAWFGPRMRPPIVSGVVLRSRAHTTD